MRFPLLMTALVSACDDTTPARLDFNQPEAMLTDTAPHPLGTRVVNEAGEPLADRTVSYSVIPTDVASVTQQGDFQCLASGDATITISGGGLSTNFIVKCRLVKTLAAESSLRLILDNDPVSFSVLALDATGSPMEDVQVNIRSEDSNVARIVGGKAEPYSVGTTTFTSQVGEVVAKTQVEVIRKIETSPLAIADGEGLLWTLQQGNYEVEVEAKSSNGAAHGVTLKWVGADCTAQYEKTHHKVKCKVDNTATLHIKNPSSFGMGPSQIGFINIYQIP